MAKDHENPDSEVAIRDFPGLKNKVAAHELVDGASHDQNNATSEDIGVMKSRRGFLVCQFDE